MCVSLFQHCFALLLPTSICSVYRVLYCVCLLCSTSDVLYSSTNNVFFLWSLQHSDLGWSVCLLRTLCCLLVCHCMLRVGRVDVKGWSSCRQVRRGCMVSAGRSVFWCPLVGAESDFCGRNGRWKGLIFRHNRVLCVFSSHSFWTSSSLDVPAGVTQEEGHTGFLIHLPSAVRALIFVARRIQPFLSLVDREVEFCVLTN